MGTGDAVRSAKETPAESQTPPSPAEIDEPYRQAVESLCAEAFSPKPFEIGNLVDVNRGRGAFSVVLRAELNYPRASPSGDGSTLEHPNSVVAKLPVGGANGVAAITGGAYTREALAYRSIVMDSPVRTPRLYAVQQPADGTCSLLLEDLSQYRAADQLDGLTPDDAVSVVSVLQRFHRAWDEPERLGGLTVRRNTVAGFSPDALDDGLEALATRWEGQVSQQQRRVFQKLVTARASLVEQFEAMPVTLCHGDPRADNLAFDDGEEAGDERSVILFDWQQLAVQFGEADLAWLAATSLEVEVRRQIDDEIVRTYGGNTDRYRLGFALPGLAVLMLAQRDFPTERARRFVSVSLQRIAAALDDLDVAALG